MSLSTFNAHIVGRLGQDAKCSQHGENYAINFSVAISEKKSNDENITSWLNCTYWSKSDKIVQYLTKGKLVSMVADFFQERVYEEKRYNSFRVRDVNPFLEKLDASNNGKPSETQPNSKDTYAQSGFEKNNVSPSNENPFSDEEDDGSLPF